MPRNEYSTAEDMPTDHGGRSMAETEATVVHPKLWHEFIDLYTTIARVRGEDLSLITLDINALKATNDTLGHAAGDRVIGIIDRVADVVPKQLRTHEEGSGRPADFVSMRHYDDDPDGILPNGVRLPEPLTARIGGGDEFAIALPNTSNEEALLIADRLVSAANKEIDLPENHELKEVGAGVAVGVATLRPGMSARDGMRESDVNMQKNKIEQLPELTGDQRAEFVKSMRHLQNSGVRLRDAQKYIEKFGAANIAELFATLGIIDDIDQSES